jgi:hypothetical protein
MDVGQIIFVLVFGLCKIHDLQSLGLGILLNGIAESLGERRQNHRRRDGKAHLLTDKRDQPTGQL